jgi:hypothetical protein
LGTTWIIGVIAGLPSFQTDEYQTTRNVLQYISIAFNGSSGFFIFLSSVVCNRKVREASKNIMRRTATFATKSTKVSGQAVGKPNKIRKRKDLGSGEMPILQAIQEDSGTSKFSKTK